jgi:DNA-binding transcriptional ArsR family regulator
MMEETKAIEALAALAQATRLRAFRALVEAGPNGIASGKLAELTATPASTLSSHLGRLEHAGLVRSRRSSRNIFYAVEIDAVRRLLGYLAQDCCGGRPELCGDLAQVRATTCEATA